MTSKGLPTPTQVIDSIGEVLEFIHKLYEVCEAAGVDVEVTIGALITAGAAAGIDEAVLAALGAAAEVTVAAYIAACVACVASAVTPDILRDALASADPQVQSQFSQYVGANTATA